MVGAADPPREGAGAAPAATLVLLVEHLSSRRLRAPARRRPSTCAPARSWRWPAWPATARPSWPRRSPATCPATAARSSIAGTNIRGLGPRAVRRSGVAYIPENRREVGLIAGQSVAVNLALRRSTGRRSAAAAGSTRRHARSRGRPDRALRHPPARPGPAGRRGCPAATSSGSSSRASSAPAIAAALIVADNFTRGLDPRSTAAVHRTSCSPTATAARRSSGSPATWPRRCAATGSRS